MPAKLAVIGGPDASLNVSLADGAKLVIGRGDTANLRVTDTAVSRSHCLIEYVLGKPVLKDAGSRSGTRVNGKPVTEHPLANDDVIEVGHTRIRFQWTAPRPRMEASREESPEVQALRALAGTRLGYFDLEEPLGAGTTGLVFRAQDTKAEREVALKVYTPAFARNEEDLQRFIRAVKTMLPLRHSNLVTLLGGGKTGPHCWMSMDFIAGENLYETIARIGREGKLDWRPALRVALDVARGLHYIHSEDIVHRNLGPGKILFSRRGVAHLGSLLRAKALSGALATDVTTGAGFLSDVRFLSPEQVSESSTVDGRSDLYGLGALVYALLTGGPPFDEGTAVRTASAIVQREVTPPRVVDPTIPAPLEAIVLRLLAKKPEARYQTANEVLSDLEELPRV